MSCQDSSWLLSWTINRQGPLNLLKKPVLHFIKDTVIVKLLWDHDVLQDVVKGVK